MFPICCHGLDLCGFLNLVLHMLHTALQYVQRLNPKTQSYACTSAAVPLLALLIGQRVSGVAGFNVSANKCNA